MAWTINEDVWIERNADGYARLIRHLLDPFPEDPVSGNPYQLAVAYLRVVRNLLGITHSRSIIWPIRSRRRGIRGSPYNPTFTAPSCAGGNGLRLAGTRQRF